MVELITREQARRKYNDNNTLPGLCNAPECQLLMGYSEIATELRIGQVCIFVNGIPAYKFSGKLASGEHILSKFYVQHVNEVTVDQNTLTIRYHDGVTEEYSFLDHVQAWKFDKKNISVNVGSTSAN